LTAFSRTARIATDDHPIGRWRNLDTGLDHLFAQGLDQLGAELREPHLTTCHGGGAGVGAHLDPIRE
jgi:hypothetical protein